MDQLVSSAQVGKHKLRRDVGYLIGGSGLIVLCSWLRVLFSGSIMVDDHPLHGLPALFIYVLFAIGLLAYSIGGYRIWKQNCSTLGQIRLLAYVVAFMFSFMLPFLSNDIFSVITYGDLANKGVDVFSQHHATALSPFISFCNPLGSDGPCVYGPACLGFSQLSALIAHGNIYVAILVYKLISLLWIALFIEAAYRTAQVTSFSQSAFMFIVLNPVFMLQGAGQLHCDLIALAFTACTVYAVAKQKINLAFIFAALAIAVKMNYILILPYIVVMLYIKRSSIAGFITRSSIGFLLAASVLFVLYLPYLHSVNTLLIPFQVVYDQVPTKSIPEVFGSVIFYAHQYLYGDLQLANAMVADGALAAQKLLVWNNVMNVCRSIALATSFLLIFNFFRNRKDQRNWMKTYPKLLLLFLLFYSHVIYPWYLVMFLPFLWYEKDKSFMVWLWVLTCFSNAQTIMSVIDRNSSVYILVIPLILVNVLLFLWRFKANFLESGFLLAEEPLPLPVQIPVIEPAPYSLAVELEPAETV